MNSQYKELTDKAVNCHQSGDIETALKLYAQLLSINPDDANVLNLTGLLMLSAGNAQEAIEYITKAFIINPTAQIQGNLGKAYYAAGMYEKAVKLFLESLKLEETDDIYYSLGLAYRKLGNIDSAIEAYKNALEQNPGNFSSCYNLSLAYKNIGDIDNAIFYAEKCKILKEDDEGVYAILSGLYEATGNYEEAVKALKKASSINPDNYSYYYNMAIFSSELGRTKDAIEYYFKVISLNPEHIPSYVNLSNITRKLKEGDENENKEMALNIILQGYSVNPKEEILLLSLAQLYKDMYRNAESIKIINEILTLNPNCDQAYSLMAINCMDTGNYEEALQCYDIAIKLNPNDINFYHGRAIALKYLGREDECREILENIINSAEVTNESKITLGMLYLQHKELQKGMQLYHYRADDFNLQNYTNGEVWEPDKNIENKSVHIYTNCGLGDTVMCARYLPYLNEKVKNIIFQTDETLVAIMQESFPNVNVIKKSVKPPLHDISLQFMDILLALNVDLYNIPLSKGYLKANEAAVKMFSSLPIFQNDKKKIGLYWQGNKNIFKNRSVNFDTIKQLTENKNLNFYSFQLGFNLEETDNLFDLSPHIKDYSDTAALLKNIDTLITIDSSIVHVAGALGVKTYLLLPKTAEWRWFYDEKTTPWYDSVTIFKQKESNNWVEVLDRVKKAL